MEKRNNGKGSVNKMKVWLIWEDYGGDRILVAVASSREKVDELLEQHYKRYGPDSGNISWEEWEVDEIGQQ